MGDSKGTANDLDQGTTTRQQKRLRRSFVRQIGERPTLSDSEDSIIFQPFSHFSLDKQRAVVVLLES